MSTWDYRNNPLSLNKSRMMVTLNAKKRRQPIVKWVSYLLDRAERSNYDISCEEIAIVLNNKNIKTTRGLEWNARRVESFIQRAYKAGEL
jgi:glutaredoxin 2